MTTLNWWMCAYCSRDAGTELRLLSGQHSQSSRSSLPQPLVLLSTVKYKQLQTVVPCGQIHLLHLRTQPGSLFHLSNIFASSNNMRTSMLPLCLRPSYTCTLWRRLEPGHAPQTCSLRFLVLPSPLWSFVCKKVTSIQICTLNTDAKLWCQNKNKKQNEASVFEPFKKSKKWMRTTS